MQSKLSNKIVIHIINDQKSFTNFAHISENAFLTNLRDARELTDAEEREKKTEPENLNAIETLGHFCVSQKIGKIISLRPIKRSCMIGHFVSFVFCRFILSIILDFFSLLLRFIFFDHFHFVYNSVVCGCNVEFSFIYRKFETIEPNLVKMANASMRFLYFR